MTDQQIIASLKKMKRESEARWLKWLELRRLLDEDEAKLRARRKWRDE